jgi:hypothetical protein
MAGSRMNKIGISEKYCPGCDEWYDEEVAFRKYGQGKNSLVYQTTARECLDCEAEKRDAAKQKDRFISKAAWSADKHGKKVGLTRSDMFKIWGWDRLAELMKKRFPIGCDYCWHAYTGMGHGPFEQYLIPLEILDDLVR